MSLGRIFLNLILGFLFLLSTFFAFPLAFALDSAIHIIHTNDIHGNFESVWDENKLKIIGLDFIKGVKNKLPNSILIDAGDAVQGSPLCSLNQNGVVDLMNETGYDIVIPGNHDFDFTLDQVMKNAELFKCPILGANLLNSVNNVPIFQKIKNNNGENFIIEINGKKLGFFGLITTETPMIIPPDNITNLKFRDEIEVAREQVEILRRRQADIVIAVAHMGVGASTNYTTEKLAQEVNGIDIIIDGHSHTKMTKKVNNTIIQQNGAKSANLGIIEINFEGKIPKINAYLMSAEEVGEKFSADSNISAKYKEKIDEIRPTIERVVGFTETPLYGGVYNNNNIARSFETNLGDLMCDAMLDYADENISGYENIPKVAFFHGGALRDTLQAGFISYGNIMKAIQYENKISAQIITPKILYQVIERGIGKLKYSSSDYLEGAFGGFPQVSGMKFDFDISKEPYDLKTNTGGTRVTSLSLVDSNGKKCKNLNCSDDTTKIMFVSNDSMTHEFPAIANIEKIKVGPRLADVLSDYIYKLSLKNGSINCNMSGNRINLVNEKIEKFDSVITIKDQSGIITDSEINLNIDGNLSKKFKTDKNGNIYIKNLSTGAHVIRAEFLDLQGEVLVSNFCNIKNNDLVLKSKLISDFRSVENLIGQILHNSSENDKKLIKFARKSYNMLSDLSKNKVINYCKLERAEREIQGGIGFISKNKEIMIVSIIFVSSVAILAVMIVIKKKKCENKNA